MIFNQDKSHLKYKNYTFLKEKIIIFQRKNYTVNIV